MKQPANLVILGTRPEAIKLGPVIRQLRAYRGELETRVAVTGQHRSMLDQILKVFDIQPDYDLDIMRDNQSLTDISVRSLYGLEKILRNQDFRLVMVQGDTTTAFIGALSAFYHKIPVAHVEAGLRTREKYNPYPEEMNRHLVDCLSDLCFAATPASKCALLNEGIDAERILITGNTVIDALQATVNTGHIFKNPVLRSVVENRNRKTLLVTVHRRENHGEPIREICRALRDIVGFSGDLQVVLPVHLNPNVHGPVYEILGGVMHVHLVDPLNYPDFVNLLARAHLVLTDSGGVQEEAPALGKPVLVLRETTERPEAISAGTARLIGTQKDKIVAAVYQLLEDPGMYRGMANAVNPYGDGHASERIVDEVRRFLGLTHCRPEEFTPLEQIECVPPSIRVV